MTRVVEVQEVTGLRLGDQLLQRSQDVHAGGLRILQRGGVRLGEAVLVQHLRLGVDQVVDAARQGAHVLVGVDADHQGALDAGGLGGGLQALSGVHAHRGTRHRRTAANQADSQGRQGNECRGAHHVHGNLLNGVWGSTRIL
ncbi:hypothetical protein D3C72_1998170 [compost metagenome]